MLSKSNIFQTRLKFSNQQKNHRIYQPRVVRIGIFYDYEALLYTSVYQHPPLWWAKASSSTDVLAWLWLDRDSLSLEILKRTGAKSRFSLDSLSRLASEFCMELLICRLILVNSSALVLAWWWYIIFTPVTTESLNLKLYRKEFFLFLTALLYLTSKSLIFWSNSAICWQAFSNFSLASVSFSSKWLWSIAVPRSTVVDILPWKQPFTTTVESQTH